MTKQISVALRSPDALDAGKFEDESQRIAEMLNRPAMDAAERRAAAAAARDIVLKARAETRQSGLMESFLEEFGLSNPEGLADVLSPRRCQACRMRKNGGCALIAEKINQRRMGRSQRQSNCCWSTPRPGA